MKLREYDLFTRLIRTRPLMLATFMYLVGCILSYALNFPPIIYAVSLLILLCAAFLLRKHKRGTAAALLAIAMIPAGAWMFGLSWQRTDPLPDQRNALLYGRICEIPQFDAEAERTICVLENLSIDGAACRGKLRLYLRGDITQLQAVELGQNLQCYAHIWKADEATNPGQFNFSNYLRLHGLRGYATAEIENAVFSMPILTRADTPKRLRAAIGQRIDQLFSENTAIAKAFLIGEKSGLSNEEREIYSKSGAAHLLAISGMHITVLASLISWLLGKFLRREYAFLLSLLLLLTYGGLIGFGSSLLRAILMFTIFGFAPLTGRYSEAPTRLSAALLVSLLIRPCAILEGSFILSYGATAGIIFLYNPILRLVRADQFVEENTNVGLFCRNWKSIASKLISALAVTAAAQMAILPAVVHLFGAQPLWSFLVNLIAAPLAMLGYIVSIFATILNFSPLAIAADFLFGLLTHCVSVFANLPLATLRIARFPIWLLLFYYTLLFLSSDLCYINRKLHNFLPLIVLLAIPIANFCSFVNTLGCSVVFLDAGQADCAVIRTEGNIYLVDTGDSYTPAADYLSAMNYNVDGVFLSHCHTDHAGGLAEILNVATPETIYISENWHQFEMDETIIKALDTARSNGSILQTVSAGDEIQLSEKTLLRVLAPAAGISANSANEDSLILHLSYGDANAVFCGDAPNSVFSGNVGDIDLLKVAHHGGSDALDAHLLSELTPSVAVIPVGYNSYGHPASKTLELLDAAGARICRTDENGAISCRLKEDGNIVVQVYQTSEDANGLE